MILIGNALSFLAAMFLFLSSILKRKDKIFIFQFFECATLAVASFFFGAYAGISTLLLSAVRNVLIAKNKFGKTLMYVFLILTVTLGIITNNKGIVGLMPVIATVQITVCGCVFEGILETKISIAANTVIWVVYSFIIKDFSTGIIDSIVFVAAVASTVKFIRESRKHTRNAC